MLANADSASTKPATEKHLHRLDKKRVIELPLFLVDTGPGAFDRVRDFSEQARYSARPLWHTVVINVCMVARDRIELPTRGFQGGLDRLTP
jgi:hypothetical protein